MVVILMGRMVDGFEEHFEARRPANIFLGCAQLTTEKDRQTRARRRLEEVEHFDAVLKIVA